MMSGNRYGEAVPHDRAHDVDPATGEVVGLCRHRVCRGVDCGHGGEDAVNASGPQHGEVHIEQ